MRIRKLIAALCLCATTAFAQMDTPVTFNTGDGQSVAGFIFNLAGGAGISTASNAGGGVPNVIISIKTDGNGAPWVQGGNNFSTVGVFGTLNNSPIQVITNSLIHGEIGADGLWSLTRDDAATNTASDVAILQHNTSGTPAVGFGTSLLFRGETDTTVNRDMARITASWSEPTDSSRDGFLSIFTTGAAVGVLDEVMRISRQQVLIGIATPNIVLQPNGNASFRSTTGSNTVTIGSDTTRGILNIRGVFLNEPTLTMLVGGVPRFEIQPFSTSTSLRYFSGPLSFEGLVGGMTLSANGDLAVDGTLSAALNTFNVDVNGDITLLHGITTSFPSVNSAGVLHNNGAGVYSIVADGGTGGGLPAGTNMHTLRHNGTSWIDTGVLQMDTLVGYFVNGGLSIGGPAGVLPPANLYVSNDNGAGPGSPIGVSFETYFGGGIAGSVLAFDRYLGTRAVPAVVNNGRILGTQIWRGYDGTGTLTLGEGAAIEVYATQTWDSLNHGAQMSFFSTNQNTAGVAEKLRFDSAGQVVVLGGAGTTGTDAPILELRSGNSGSTSPTLQWNRNGTDLAQMLTNGTDFFVDYPGILTFRTGVAGTTTVKLSASALDTLFGINRGGATPAAILDVLGNIPASVAGNGTAATQVGKFTGAKGGDTSGTTGQTAGAGGGFAITTGDGGNAPSGSTNGVPGNIVFQIGVPGSGAGTAAAAGSFQVNPNGNGRFGVGTSNPAQFMALIGPSQPSVSGNGAAALQVLRVLGGDGGATSGTTGQSGGTGALVEVLAGNGGNAPSGSTNGPGGKVVISGGSGGTGAGAAASFALGSGQLTIQNNGGGYIAFGDTGIVGYPVTFNQIYVNISQELQTPAQPTATPSGAGGTCATSTFFYKITAFDGASTDQTIGSVERGPVNVTGPTGSVALTWTATPGAKSYRIYRGTVSGSENVFYTSTTNSFTDTCAANTGGSPPASSTASASRISNNGNSWFIAGPVGIGTATPTAALHIGTQGTTQGFIRMDGIAGNPSSPTDGDVWYNTTQESLRFQEASGTQGVVGLVFDNTADSTAIASSNTENLFDRNYTFPANSFTVGKAIRVTAYGRYSNTGTPTLTLRVKVGGVAGSNACVAPAYTTPNGVTNKPWSIECTFIIRTTGAGGTATGNGFVSMTTSATVANAQSSSPLTNAGTFAVDTTATKQVGVSAQWSAASASNTTTLETITIEVLD